jgi:hypothetical protein
MMCHEYSNDFVVYYIDIFITIVLKSGVIYFKKFNMKVLCI